MKKMRRLLVLALAIVINVAPSFADEKTASMTFNEAAQHAILYNPQSQVFKKQFESVRSEIMRAGTLSNPELTAVKDRDETEIELVQEYQLGWGTGRQAAQLSYQIAKQEFDIFTLGLIRDVAIGMIQLNTSQRLVKYSKEIIGLNRSFYKIAKFRYDKGEMSKIDLLMLEQELDMAIQEKILLEKDYQIELANYRLFIGHSPLPSDELHLIPGKFPSILRPKYDLKTRVKSHPQMTLLELEKKKIEKDLAFSKWKWIPPITLGARYKKENSESKYGFVVGVPIPIFDRNQADIYENTRLEEKNMFQRQSTEAQLLQDIQRLKLETTTIESQLHYYKSRFLPQTETMKSTIKLAYEQGRTDVFKLLFIQRQQIEMKQKYIKTQGDYQMTVVNLHHALGHSIINVLKQEVSK